MTTPAPRRQLSVTQMMKLVAFAAGGSMTLTPIVELMDLGLADWPAVLIYGAVAVPLVWAGMTRLFVRPGAFREWAFVALLLTSVVSALVMINYVLATVFFVQFRRLGLGSFGPHLTTLLIFVGADLVLGAGLVVLLRLVVPARCPACGRRRLIRSGRVAPAPGGPRNRLHAVCVACGARFYRRPSERRPLPEPCGHCGTDRVDRPAAWLPLEA